MTSHDPAKRRKNLEKHDVDLPTCEQAFDAPMLTRKTIAKSTASNA